MSFLFNHKLSRSSSKRNEKFLTEISGNRSPVTITKASPLILSSDDGNQPENLKHGFDDRRLFSSAPPSPSGRRLKKSVSLEKFVLSKMTSFTSVPTTSSPSWPEGSLSREGSLTGSVASFTISEDALSTSDVSLALSQDLSEADDGEPSATSPAHLSDSETPNTSKKKKSLFKFPFARKVKTPKMSRRTSSADVKDTVTLEVPQVRQSRSFCLDPEKANDQVDKMLVKIKQNNNSLKMKVSQKNEELEMLNASIDQMNRTWEEKVKALQRDVEKQKIKNQRLQSMIDVESNPQPKTAKRIPVNNVGTKTGYGRTKTSATSLPSQSQATTSRKQVVKKTLPMDVTAKNEDVRQRLKDALMASKHFRSLSNDHLDQLVAVMQFKKIIQGERLMREGTPSKFFYVLVEGECRTYKEVDVTLASSFDEISKPVMRWTVFGEAGVFYKSPRMISCKCSLSGVVGFVSREDFHRIARQDGSRREIYYFLKKLRSFRNFEARELRHLAHVSKVEFYVHGDYVVREGDVPDSVYIIKEGFVRVTRQIDGTENLQKTLRAGHIFGDDVGSGSNLQNYIADGGEVVQCIVVPMVDYEVIKSNIAPLSENASDPNVVEETKTTSSRTSGYSSSSNGSSDPALIERNRYDPDHLHRFKRTQGKLKNAKKEMFNYIAAIGQGAFGSVDLVSTKTGEYNVFAIKKLSKQQVLASELENHVRDEWEWQMRTSMLCPFVTSLYSIFEDSRFYYFVMEFCSGGELFTLIKSMNGFNDRQGRFYAACVTEALNYLHSKRIIFRDLKPENVVIDRTGYCKLTDFGFAKILTKESKFRTYTMCGTPEYTSPEIILGQAQTFTVDMWALGVLIYELLVGKAPFLNKHRKDLDESILNGIDPKLQSKSAENLTSEAKSIIHELCQLRPEERLGSGKQGMKNLAAHEWFKGFDWSALRQRSMTPPWVPELRSAQDTKYFDIASKGKDKNNDEKPDAIRL